MEKRRLESEGHDYASHGVEKYQRTDNNSYGYDKNDSYKYSSRDSNYSSSRSSNSYSSRDNSYSSRDNSGGYSSRDNSGGYSSRDNSYQSRDSGGGGYSRNSDYSSRDGGYSRDGYRNDSYNSSGYRGQRGGYGGRGRGGRGGGFGGQSGDSWSCSSCKFSNYASRYSCYKCKTPKDGSSGRRWDSNDSGWKKSSWGDKGRRDKYDDGKSSGWANGDGLINWDEALKQADQMNAAKWANLPKIVKDLYKEDPEISAMTDEEVKELRASMLGMEVKCINKEYKIPNPVKQFEQAFSDYPLILKEISKQGFEAPSAIQCQSWPILMKGHDMIGTSQTGSGKTLAFLLPGLLHICAQPTPRWERSGPTCLVLAPTRELAQQIEREVLKFQYDNIRVVCCYGQGDKRNQIQKLNAMSEIVIATPGRLNDFASQDLVDLSGVSYLVLDEADRMLDMGFEPQVRKIVMNIRPDRQTILTSATWPDEVQSLANKLLTDPVHVIVGSLDLQAVDTITQKVVVCSVMEKEEKLLEFMKSMKPEDKAIVFVAQKIFVDDLSVKLLEAGYAVESMHGGRNQRDREYSLRQLKTGRSKILIATDVAARGIDINDITHVVNYDCPKDMEEYVHRVGRTGRAGRSGEALTLMCRDDWKVAGKLIEILEKSNQDVPRDLVRMKERFDRVREESGGGRDRYSRNGKIMGYGGSLRNGWTPA